MKQKQALISFISFMLMVSFAVLSCSSLNNNIEKTESFSSVTESTTEVYSSAIENTDNPNQQIDLMENYVLSHYLEPTFTLCFSYLYFVINDTYDSDTEFTPSSFLPDMYLSYISKLESFEKLTEDRIPKSKFEKTGLIDDGIERDCYIVPFDKLFFVKDMLEVIKEAKKKDYIYFVFGSIGGGSWRVAPKLPIPDEKKPIETNMMDEAVKLFDTNHNFLDGYYNEFNICLVHEASGEQEYTFKEVMPSFYKNTDAIFAKIQDEDTVNDLDKTLPENAEKKSRDWYKVSFPFRFEAQYALQLYQELTRVKGVFYVTSSLCNNDSLNIKVPLFEVFVGAF